MKVWQIATGEPGRDYRQLFFDYGVMILGPSRLGDALASNYHDGISNSPGSQVHRFAHNPAPGDRVIMRFAHDVIGIGRIPDGESNQYSFKEAFRCVYGWDLSHCRRVIWAQDYKLGKLTEVFRHAKQKPSFTEVHETRILKMVESIDNSHFKRRLKRMPSIDSSIYTEDELGVELFQAGISNRNISDIIQALQQAKRLCAWYRSSICGRKPSENEMVSHTILPLFLGLGWSHQQIAIEWNKVDMAFFKATPTTEENCVMVVEAKGLGQALSEVLDQPQQYVVRLGLRNVKRVVTTDGENIFVYGKKQGQWDSVPVGYINVLSLQKKYILPKGIDLVKSLVELQPGSI